MPNNALAVVDYADGNGEMGGFYSHGHHAPRRFRAAVRAYVSSVEGLSADESLDEDIAQALRDATIRHQYWKTMPEEASQSGEEEYRRVPKGTRGSYPVTVMEVRW